MQHKIVAVPQSYVVASMATAAAAKIIAARVVNKALVLAVAAAHLPHQAPMVVVVRRWLIVTQEFFSGIINQAPSDCVGKNFYTRDGFINAVNSYSDLGKRGSVDESKREIAAFFAHATHETGYFCFIEEDEATRETACRPSTDYPCNPDKNTTGSIGLDLLNSPETVASDAAVAFKTAIWYWVGNVRSVLSQGFGATTRAINGAKECDGQNSAAVQARAALYKSYCSQFNVDPGTNLSC
ncbi:homolog of carrot EP3-3 chitinase [Prunus dulcis]|uniref:chitinase n=1 Tax=Prunus dulcis TaxID=3755 RepID=A0A5H2Y189_PRUDU|nr:homolog of carrot EP3-3 chitinase [Prunus dulcis]